jgi:hypothetical protein
VWPSPATAMFKSPSRQKISNNPVFHSLLRPRTGALRFYLLRPGAKW